jgi:Ohr subfamily peroxiredoxin
MDSVYTAEALSTGSGRNGHVVTKDGLIDTEVRISREMGGEGGAPNPELFFAAGYAACFHSALHAVARARKVRIENTTVGARVGLAGDVRSGFGLRVQLEVVVPGVPHDEAVELAEAAHRTCPYSNATRGNIDVEVSVVDD